MLTTKQDAANKVDMLREKNVGSATSGMKTSNQEAFAGYQQLVDALGDAVIICDRDGVIRLWNAAAERLFGFTPAEALGSSLDFIIPEPLRERHWAGFTRTMAMGKRGTSTTCCEFQPCTKTDEHCPSHLRSGCSSVRNEG